MVWANTERVGCGEHFCEKMEGYDEPGVHFLVCNYEPPGNFHGRKPYETGDPCSGCQSNYVCKDSLCEESKNLEDTTQPHISTGSSGKPIEDTSSTLGLQPMEDASPTLSSQLIEDASQTFSVKPIEDASPTLSLQPMEDVSPTLSPQPMEDASPTLSPQLIEDASQTFSVKPIEDASPTLGLQPMEDGSPTIGLQLLEDYTQKLAPQKTEDVKLVIAAHTIDIESTAITQKTTNEISSSRTVEAFTQTNKKASFRLTSPLFSTISYPTYTTHQISSSLPKSEIETETTKLNILTEKQLTTLGLSLLDLKTIEKGGNELVTQIQPLPYSNGLSDQSSVEIGKDKQDSKNTVELEPILLNIISNLPTLIPRPASSIHSEKTSNKQQGKEAVLFDSKKQATSDPKPKTKIKDKQKSDQLINSEKSDKKAKVHPLVSETSLKLAYQSHTSDRTFFGKHNSRPQIPQAAKPYCPYPCAHRFSVVAPLYRTNEVSNIGLQKGYNWWPVYNALKKPRIKQPCKTYKSGVYGLYRADTVPFGKDNLTTMGKWKNLQTR
ncbi:uncharacterized protein LOC128644660, partial [Bombina bombina]|uniref:uncharacterized protein LOC128644660 n=1 Tax=Bombina bombina TaxID=8345 RepID=UPI00235AF41E